MTDLIDFVHESVQSNYERGYSSPSAVIFSSLARFRFNLKKLETFFLELAGTKSNFAIFVPAFTYSSRRNQVFSNSIKPDPLNGALSRVAFQNSQLSFRRTHDVDYSYLLFKEKYLKDFRLDELFQHQEKSFGLNSHHAKLFELNPTLIALGEGFRDGFTPSMHIEALTSVPYREYIDTSCLIEDKHTIKRKYFARKEVGEYANLEADRKLMSYLLHDNPSYVEKTFDSGGEACAISAKEFSTTLTQKLIERPRFFVE